MPRAAMPALALALVLVLLVAVPAAASAEEAPAPARDPVARLLDAKPEDRKALVDAVVAAKPDPAAVAAALAAGGTRSADVERGWVKKTVFCADGKLRPWLLHVPAKYDPSRKHRMVVDLHGGVSRPVTLDHDDLLEMKFFWGAQAEESGWFLALPAGDGDATWWDATGAGMVLQILEETRRFYNVDEDAVFATGFSDGGSGAYHLASAHATPFAGFIPLNGHPAVAGMGGVPVFLRNLLNRPIYAVNTADDSLYPSAALKPVFEALKSLGAPLVWRDIPGFGHDPSYLPAERPAILKWMDGVRRDPDPKVLWWEGIEGAPRRTCWISGIRVSGGSGKDPFPDVNVELRETRVRLGVQLEEGFAGPGARIAGVVEDSPAGAMGLAEGDVLLAIDGEEVKDARSVRALLGKKAFGRDLVVRFRRGEGVQEKTARIPEPKPRMAFERGKPWGSLRAEAKGNRIEVACLGIESFEVLLSPRLVDMAKPVEIVVNGSPAWAGPAVPDVRFMLEQALADRDRSLVYWAKVPVAVPRK